MKHDGPTARIRILLLLLVVPLVFGLLFVSSIVAPRELAQAYSGDVHQDMARYARDIYLQYEDEPWWSLEIYQYQTYIDDGAAAEDDVDLVWDYYGTAGECITITHFWNPDNGIDDEQSCTVCFGENAAWKAMILWGMALGEYNSGDKATAYKYLGHVVHLLGDMSVPAHALKDCHPSGDTFDTDYMNGHGLAYLPQKLSDDELNGLRALGMVEIPSTTDLLPLYYLFYMTAQIAGYYPSDDVEGNTDEYDSWNLVDFGALEPLPTGVDSDFIDACDYTVAGDCKTAFEIIRRNSYFYGIRAIATLYRLFAEQSKRQAELTVVIDTIQQIDGHGDDPDYYVRVKIGDMWFRNEGCMAEDTGWDPIYPGWAFAWNVGLTGSTEVWIELWDEDPGNDDQSDIYSGPNEPENAEERAIWLTVDLGGCREGTGTAIDYDLTGACRCQLTSAGDDADRSQIWFTILPPNSPPEADAGPDQTVNEGDFVVMNGTFTDPDPEDTHTFLWHLVSSTNGQVIPDTPGHVKSFIPCDNGVYTFSFTVTDNHGAWDSDEVVITVNNVPPAVTAVYISSQENAEFILPVVHNTSFEGTLTDAGTCDTHTAVWQWGDGTTSDAVVDESGGSGTASGSHIYSLPGDYTVTLTVTDDDGASGSNTMTVHIADVDEALDIFDAYIRSLPNSKFRVPITAKLCKAAFKTMFVRLDVMLAVHNYFGMIYSLNINMRTKFDAAVGGGTIDDWIKKDLAIQTELCQKVDDITAYLVHLITS
jgi:hypothetical protein